MSQLCVSLLWVRAEPSAAAAGTLTVCFGNILGVPVLSTIFLPPCSLGSAPSPPVSCPAPALFPLTTVLSQAPAVPRGWDSPAVFSCPSPSRCCGAGGWGGVGRGPSRCSVSRAAPHEVFIGSVMLFPCQTITEIGSVCVIGERILMAQFSLQE